MLNIALELEQEQRLCNSLAAVEAQIDRETDLYDVGRRNGLIGSRPTKLKEQNYWEGYQTGLRQYWAKKLEVEIPIEFQTSIAIITNACSGGFAIENLVQ